MTELELLPVEQQIEMIREKTGAGVNLSFSGKVLARQLSRRVRPRNQRTVKAHSARCSPRCSLGIFSAAQSYRCSASY